MDKTYFKTEEGFNNAIKEVNEIPGGFSAKKSAVSCACGESQGAAVYDSDKIVEYFVFCEACYKTASIAQRGE